ncbi:hypothetical protein GCM10011581_45670 [Saccharopolyspora subtropica]|uniref:DUF7144 domain-containing protein n=1 Tax=Saccharopolyspora thermophila TaxID=89367 RepID=A0A917K900_9PSEU|nr:hypothetical protein [Saccharopolyspora subtropica]GGJ03437.1 hypothetical protein GCM10011581_45670 [Saccharopolyspora subtropica]
MATHGARRTGWAVWLYFAAAVLLVVGIIQVVNGITTFARSGTTLVTSAGSAVQISYTGIGWSFVITGVVLGAIGVGLFRGRTWARTLGIVLALISVLVNLAFFAASPLWSAVVIVLDVVVIYALAAHGAELSRR